MGDELAIAADGSRTHTLTGKAGIGAESKRVTNHDDGKETTTLSGETGTRLKHVMGSGTTDLDVISKASHTTSEEKRLSDTVTETDTTGHSATLDNDLELDHGTDEGEDYKWDLIHKRTKAGYTFKKNNTRTETFDDRKATSGRSHEVKVDGSLAKDKQSGSIGYTIGGSQRVEMNDGNMNFHEEKLGVKGGAERNVTTTEDGQRNGSYKLTTGFSKSTKDETKRVTDAGTFTEKRTQTDGLDLGYGTSDRVGSLGFLGQIH